MAGSEPGHWLFPASLKKGSRGLVRDLDVFRGARGLRYRQAVLPQALKMKFDRFADFSPNLVQCVPDRYAAGQVRDVGGEIPLTLLDHDG
jgi:hypothetical protein